MKVPSGNALARLLLSLNHLHSYMRLIKMTGGLGNQMFIYAFYMKMKRLFPNTRIDLSDMMHYHEIGRASCRERV